MTQLFLCYFPSDPSYYIFCCARILYAYTRFLNVFTFANSLLSEASMCTGISHRLNGFLGCKATRQTLITLFQARKNTHKTKYIRPRSHAFLHWLLWVCLMDLSSLFVAILTYIWCILLWILFFAVWRTFTFYHLSACHPSLSICPFRILLAHIQKTICLMC